MTEDGLKNNDVSRETSGSPEKSWILYVLKCSDETLYTGITVDLDQRVLEHNKSPKGAKYTRGRRPVAVVYSEHHESRSEASKAEAAFKKLSRTEKLARLSDY